MQYATNDIMKKLFLKTLINAWQCVAVLRHVQQHHKICNNITLWVTMPHGTVSQYMW